MISFIIGVAGGTILFSIGIVITLSIVAFFTDKNPDGTPRP
jgi:hypothetical protein